MRYAKVILDLPLLKFFEYKIPQHLDSRIKPGVFVLAPFGKRFLTGLLYDILDHSEYDDKKLKYLESVFQDYQFISTESLKLIHWISDYYVCGFGEAARLLYPNGIGIQSYLWLEINPSVNSLQMVKGKRQIEVLNSLLEKPKSYGQLLKELRVKNLHSTVTTLRKHGFISVQRKIHKPKVKPKFETVLRISGQMRDDCTTKQSEVIQLLDNGPLLQSEVLNLTGYSQAVVDALIRKKVIIREKKQVWRDYQSTYQISALGDIKLNPGQKRAVSAIVSAFDKHIFSAFLLFGITGSGKTQVYIEAMKHVLEKKHGVICLIPEISLTPQTVARFQQAFGNRVAVLHSRLGEGERFDMWRRVGTGEINIVVGARSALFAPVNNLGLIIIDEEHEHTYKQNESRPLYHARSVATMRAQKLSIPLVLGSATPSIETYYNTQQKKFELLTLPNRAIDEMHLPNINVIDLRKTVNVGNYDAIISDLLLEKIETRLYAGEQVLLLQNRRGFAAFLECPDCGHVEKCENCAVSLSYHRKDELLHCHFCGYTKKVPEKCSHCQSDKMAQKGVGTQKVEDLLIKHFPSAEIERMDYDTTSGKSGHEKILSRFASGKTNILVGTQMIAKGLDIPNVTLVGVILADVGFFIPDFRASERTFHLLTQVAGRSGRGNIPGEVVIQTYNPEHPVIGFVKNQDYSAFYTKEIRDREALGYPPFMWLALIRVEAPEEDTCLQVIKKIKNTMEGEFDTSHLSILGPGQCAFAKIKNMYRWQILIKADLNLDPKAAKTRNMLRIIFHNKQKFLPDKARLVIDVDPHWVL